MTDSLGTDFSEGDPTTSGFEVLFRRELMTREAVCFFVSSFILLGAILRRLGSQGVHVVVSFLLCSSHIRVFRCPLSFSAVGKSGCVYLALTGWGEFASKTGADSRNQARPALGRWFLI